MRDRFRGAFLGCALGDAIGRPFEMMSATDSRLGSGLGALLARSGRLSFSDDTQMMTSVAESLVRVGFISGTDVMAALAENYDPARGYGHGMRRALEAFRSGQGASAASTTWVEGSKGSGGAVRVVAVACAHHHDVPTLAALAEEVAGLTHAHPVGRAGAVAHALALADALRASGGPPDISKITGALLEHRLVSNTAFAAKLARLDELLCADADGQAAVHVLGNGLLADEAVPLALFSFLRWAPDFASVVRNTVLCGGDTDTIAAMSGALCGALVGESGLPAGWVERLENGPKGADYVRALADRTFELWDRRRTP